MHGIEDSITIKMTSRGGERVHVRRVPVQEIGAGARVYKSHHHRCHDHFLLK